MIPLLLGAAISWILTGNSLMAEAKIVQDQVRMRMNYQDLSKWEPGQRASMDGLHFASHFGCNVGICNYEIRARMRGLDRYVKRALNWNRYVWNTERFDVLRNAYNESGATDIEGIEGIDDTAPLNLRIILDTEWDKKALDRSRFSPKSTGKECLGDIQPRASRELFVPLDGSWGKKMTGTLSQTTRPHHWYFVLEDCEGSIVDRFTEVFGVKPNVFLPNLTIEYELIMTDEFGGHLGVEFKHMSTIYLSLCFLAVVLGTIFAKAQVSHYNAHREEEDTHVVLYAVDISLVFYFIHLVLRLWHLKSMARGGIGHPNWDALGTLICCLANMCLVILIFAVGLGYSLNVNQMTIPGEALVAIGICYSFVELVLSFAQYKTFSVRYHLHMSQGVIPVIIGCFRMVLGLGFWFSVKGTIGRDDVYNPQVPIFLRRFRWRGLLFICVSALIAFFVTFFIPKYLQFRWNFILRTTLELGTIMYLGYAFLSKSTSYYAASGKGSTELPSPGGFSSPRSPARGFGTLRKRQE